MNLTDNCLMCNTIMLKENWSLPTLSCFQNESGFCPTDLNLF